MLSSNPSTGPEAGPGIEPGYLEHESSEGPLLKPAIGAGNRWAPGGPSGQQPSTFGCYESYSSILDATPSVRAILLLNARAVLPLRQGGIHVFLVRDLGFAFRNDDGALNRIVQQFHHLRFGYSVRMASNLAVSHASVIAFIAIRRHGRVVDNHHVPVTPLQGGVLKHLDHFLCFHRALSFSPGYAAEPRRGLPFPVVFQGGVLIAVTDESLHLPLVLVDEAHHSLALAGCSGRCEPRVNSFEVVRLRPVVEH